MTFLADPARTTPQTRLAPARGSRRRDSAPGQLGDQLAERVGEVLGQVRAGGVPAAAGEPDRERVGGAGERADPQADLADVDGGVAVQAVDVPDAVEGAGGDHLERTAGHHLLGGLEQQPDPAGERGLPRGRGQREPGADQGGGVHVVAAGVRDARRRCWPTARRAGRRRAGRRGRRAARRAGRCRAPSSAISPRLRAAAGRRGRRLSSRSATSGGGPRLLPGELGVGVQVAAERDQLGLGDDASTARRSDEEARAGYRQRPGATAAVPRPRAARQGRPRSVRRVRRRPAA